MAAAGGALGAALRGFPGIVTRRAVGTASHVHETAGEVVVVLVFAAGRTGQVATLVVDFIMSHMGRDRRLDSHAPVQQHTGPGCGCGTPNAVHYVCTPRQAAIAARMLRYASADTQGPSRPHALLSSVPLPVLLSHALCAFRDGYRQAVGEDLSLPSMGLWANVLRAIPDAGLDRRELPARTVLSLRGMRAVLRDLERRRWLTSDKQGRGVHLLRLTASGRQARDAGPRLVANVERRWRRRFGTGEVAALHTALADIARQFDVCWPWSLTGYGPGDASVTGGGHVPGVVGPPRIPPHGADWPVVLRKGGGAARRPPLPALLSEVLAAFTMDYEWDAFGYGAGLWSTSNLLQFVKASGMALEEAAARGDVRGNGKSGLERHLVVVVESGKPGDGSRRVHLTPKGQRARDSHAYLVEAVEQDWQRRYGKAVAALRQVLERLDRQLGEGWPNYPDTTAWFLESLVVGGAAARRR